MYVAFRRHVELVFRSFVGCKVRQFRGFKQDSEDFLPERGGALRQALHLVESIAEVVQEGGFRAQGAAEGVRELQEHELDARGHELADVPLAEVVPEVDLTGTRVHAEVHQADEIDRREVVVHLPGLLLLLDGESGVVQRTIVEVVLGRHLDLADEPRAIPVVALDVQADVLAVFEQVHVFDIVGPDFRDVVFRDDFLEEEPEEFEAVLLEEEGPLEPAVEQDAGVPAHGRLLGIHDEAIDRNLPMGNGRSGNLPASPVAQGPAGTKIVNEPHNPSQIDRPCVMFFYF